MNCAWYEPRFWFTGPLVWQIVWILILIGIGYLIFRLITGYRTQPAAGSGYAGTVTREQCPNCGAPVEKAFIRCPECHFQLKTNCPNCGKIVKTSWDICPYCETQLKHNKR